VPFQAKPSERQFSSQPILGKPPVIANSITLSISRPASKTPRC